MSFLVGVNRSRTTVVVVHRETNKRFDMDPWHASDIAHDDGNQYELTTDDVMVGIGEADVVELRKDIKGVLKFVEFPQ